MKSGLFTVYTCKKEGNIINSRNIFAVVMLTIVWVILSESYSWLILSTGVITSVLIVQFCKRTLPINMDMSTVSLGKLWFYPFFIIWQVYLAGWAVLKIVLSPAGERTDFVVVQSQLKSELLKAMLFDSVTLTPGTIYIDTENEESTVVWLRGAHEPDPQELTDVAGDVLSTLENALSKAED